MEMITRSYPLEEIARSYENLATGKNLRAVVRYPEIGDRARRRPNPLILADLIFNPVPRKRYARGVTPCPANRFATASRFTTPYSEP